MYTLVEPVEEEDNGRTNVAAANFSKKKSRTTETNMLIIRKTIILNTMVIMGIQSFISRLPMGYLYQ